jgi:HNH/ENDO VII superfamily nuclease with conserved GHE residues
MCAEAATPRTPDGRPIDPNNGQPIDGTPDFGHKPGNEFWREKQTAESEGLTQQQFSDRMNDPSKDQLDDASSNRSHRYEQPR